MEFYYCCAERICHCSGPLKFDPVNFVIEVETVHTNHKTFTMAEIEVEKLKVCVLFNFETYFLDRGLLSSKGEC